MLEIGSCCSVYPQCLPMDILCMTEWMINHTCSKYREESVQ